MTDQRFIELLDWLDELDWVKVRLEPASADASFRRYFRVFYQGNSYIAMDAPPDKEDCRPFVRISNAFANAGLNVPKVIAEDHDKGFLLLDDLGQIQYADELEERSVDRLYNDAMTALVTLQQRGKQADCELPLYDEALLRRELALFAEWFLGEHLAITLSAQEQEKLEQAFKILIDNALEQPQVWVHRDFHSRNLMVTKQDNPGVLDFQDAVLGPITYDLVSLLKDCYVDWPSVQVDAWLFGFYQRQPLLKGIPLETVKRWFDLMGVQRHFKAIGIFSRLNYRDGKPTYLDDIPRTLNYVRMVATQYPELAAISELIEQRVLPKLGVQAARVN